jgi:DNA-binding winged helix-turn-helix (wHTH) protein
VVILPEHQFGPFRIDPSIPLLLYNERPVRLEPQAVAVLRVLVENRKRWLSPAFILENAWKGTFVGPRNVIVQVSKIKQTLNDFHARLGECIESNRQLGYQFSDETVRELLNDAEPIHRSPLLISPKDALISAPATESQNSGNEIWFDSKSKSMWQMRRSIFLPISKEDLDPERGKLGMLRRLETPQAVLAEATADRPDLIMGSDIYEFLRDLWSNPKKYHSILEGHPALKTWITNVWAPLLPGSQTLERKQLGKFYDAMQSPEIEERLLPGFTYNEVSCWRVFVQVFPESIHLLEAASAVDISNAKRMTVAALSSTLAVTDDWGMSMRAMAIAARLLRETSARTVYSYREYKLIRHYLYAAVEAGVCPAERFLDFVHNPHHSFKWELQFNREYYKDESDAPLALAAVRKIERPLNRDAATKKISEDHRELLPRHLIEKAYDRLRRK